MLEQLSERFVELVTVFDLSLLAGTRILSNK